jgi:hypothetical protein
MATPLAKEKGDLTVSWKTVELRYRDVARVEAGVNTKLLFGGPAHDVITLPEPESLFWLAPPRGQPLGR